MLLIMCTDSLLAVFGEITKIALEELFQKPIEIEKERTLKVIF